MAARRAALDVAPRRGAPAPDSAVGDGAGHAAAGPPAPLDRRFLLTVLVAGALALASSGWHLGRRPLWLDEAFSLGATAQLGRTIRDTGGTMALYYVLLDGWTAVFGSSVLALRSLSVALIVVGVAVSALVVRRLLSGPEAVVATLVLAGLPAIPRMGQEARSYALATVLAAAGWLCLSRALEDDDAGRRSGARRWSVGLAVVAVAGVLAHGLFLLQVGAMVASVVVLPQRRRLGLVLPAAVAGLLTVGGLVLIGAADVGDWIPPLDRHVLGLLSASTLGTHGAAATILALLALTGAVALMAWPAVDDLHRWRRLAPLWWGLGPAVALVALSTVRPSLLGRYLLPSAPGVAMLVAVGAVAVARRASILVGGHGGRRNHGGDLARRLVTTTVVVVVVGALVVARIDREDNVYGDWDGAVRAVAAGVEGGDGLVFPPINATQAHPDTMRAPFEAAWARLGPHPVAPEVLSPARPLGEVRRFDPLTDLAVLRAAVMARDRVWVVQGSGSIDERRAILSSDPPAPEVFRRQRTVDLDGGVQVLLYVKA